MPLSPRRLFGKVKSRGACRQGPSGKYLKPMNPSCSLTKPDSIPSLLV